MISYLLAHCSDGHNSQSQGPESTYPTHTLREDARNKQIPIVRPFKTAVPPGTSISHFREYGSSPGSSVSDSASC